MFRIRTEQLQVFEVAAALAAVERSSRRVEAEFPEVARRLGAGLEAFVRETLLRAQPLKLRSNAAFDAYLDATCVHGPAFETRPDYAGVRAYLTDFSLDEDARILLMQTELASLPVPQGTANGP